MNNTPENETKTDGCGSLPLANGSASFPKIPERDEHGDACLYPGASKFEGAAALYNTEHGEVVILAPNIEALEAQARKFGIADRLFHRDRCIITEARRVPNIADEGRR